MKPRWTKPGNYVRGVPNKTEYRYISHLESLKLGGFILDYVFEPISLKLAFQTRYTPDFMVVFDDRIELHEIKGHWEDDARVKWKVAAKMFPWFRFVAVTWKQKQWTFEYADGGE